jgi:hypothetical protein
MSAQDSTARTAEAKLKANIATLIAYIKANKALPRRPRSATPAR